MDWFARQRISPNGTETLLDHYLSVRWHGFRERLPHLIFHSSSRTHLIHLAVVTLLDQLDPTERDWHGFSMILDEEISNKSLLSIREDLDNLFGCTESRKAGLRILSRFLMDRERAGLFWVNSQTYVELAKILLETLCNG
ncbi:hypothetical protein M413DRAFT_375322 [Hebeloma cylindrosporum]|uniref:Uncharacterized protein n=1 Tax=Hebeloma cylindrosporum TaxID=76867 RepID=A0A0C3C5L6_HEBCY|nr:hypothetical protein M413DRAFT_375322 [Hebeloma cylindrosporum h7]